jgi:aminopeptidase N
MEVREWDGEAWVLFADADIEIQRVQADERRRADAIEVDLQNAEVVIRNLRRQITRLENDAEREVAKKRDGKLIEDIAAYWRETCGHPKAKVSMDGKRADAIWARLTQKPKAFSVDELKRAVYGCSLFPYVGQGGRVRAGTPKQRFDDLELICRDEKSVERFIELADMEDAKHDDA